MSKSKVKKKTYHRKTNSDFKSTIIRRQLTKLNQKSTISTNKTSIGPFYQFKGKKRTSTVIVIIDILEIKLKLEKPKKRLKNQSFSRRVVSALSKRYFTEVPSNNNLILLRSFSAIFCVL